MFTATVPSGFDGYKVHNGDRWFGDDGTPDKTTAYIFNYSGDKALYEVSAEPVTVGACNGRACGDGILSRRLHEQLDSAG
ncbi:MAG: hypothetical protein II513_09265 [Ruminococcus sp.]|nr:hypothetical protein [Ruminococcus sp.]